MKQLIFVSTILLAAVASGQVTGNCAHWNSSITGGGIQRDYYDSTGHVPPSSGEHWLYGNRGGTCTYTCPTAQCNPNTVCIATAEAFDTPEAGDRGAVTPSGYVHTFSKTEKGQSSTTSGQITAQAAAAAYVASCLPGGCSTDITVTAGGVITEKINGQGSAVWTGEDTFIGFCQLQKAYPQTPIIIDTENEGYQLTNAYDGVTTKMVDPGRSIHVAWTKPGSHNAFLYLDGHLFGNSTPQQPFDGCRDPATGCGNGFEALRVYDNNGDGVIDASDPVFSQLRLWIDSNHDGAVQPQELSTLPAMGVYSISLHYEISKRTDANGNVFRYRGHLQKAADGTDRTIYDVLLTITDDGS